jgi:transcription elongation factor Elf1
MKVVTKKAGKLNHLMNLYTKYGDALCELKKKKKEETNTAEIEEIDEEL